MPGFVGSRLKRARTGLGLSQVALSALSASKKAKFLKIPGRSIFKSLMTSAG
jgi:hypothetical protein